MAITDGEEERICMGRECNDIAIIGILLIDDYQRYEHGTDFDVDGVLLCSSCALDMLIDLGE